MGTGTAEGETFEFSYRLTGTGWAEAHVSDGTHHLNPTASYLSDALRNLVEAAAIVTEGVPEARCHWDEEPGEFRWLFGRTADELSVRVLWFDDFATDAPDEEGEVVFETVQPVLAVARRILSGAQRVLDDLGPGEYERRWVRYPFPGAAVDRLRASIAERAPGAPGELASGSEGEPAPS